MKKKIYHFFLDEETDKDNLSLNVIHKNGLNLLTSSSDIDQAINLRVNSGLTHPIDSEKSINTCIDTSNMGYNEWLTCERKDELDKKIGLWINRNGELNAGKIEFAAHDIAN